MSSPPQRRTWKELVTIRVYYFFKQTLLMNNICSLKTIHGYFVNILQYKSTGCTYCKNFFFSTDTQVGSNPNFEWHLTHEAWRLSLSLILFKSEETHITFQGRSVDKRMSIVKWECEKDYIAKISEKSRATRNPGLGTPFESNARL